MCVCVRVLFFMLTLNGSVLFVKHHRERRSRSHIRGSPQVVGFFQASHAPNLQSCRRTHGHDYSSLSWTILPLIYWGCVSHPIEGSQQKPTRIQWNERDFEAHLGVSHVVTSPAVLWDTAGTGQRQILAACVVHLRKSAKPLGW